MEPGRDGVGDYTRRLACELIKQGHKVATVAINDNFINTTITDSQQNEGLELPVLRLSSSQPLKERLLYARNYIDKFNPEWLSLQFVIFGYHLKGLPLWLNKLSLLGKGRKWHIMFHELWLAMEINTSAKHYLWGKVQQHLISSLITQLKPKSIHTHTQLYIQQLLAMGVQSKHLPLFGNIPAIADAATNLNRFKEDKLINLILFGHIHPNTSVAAFADEMAAYAKKNQFETALTLIGNNGAETENWEKQFERLGIKVNVLGEQPANYVSEIMSNSNFGISTTPVALLEKSGSVAAMREHGLPVICVPCTWEPAKFINLELPGNIMIYKKGNLDKILNEEINFAGFISISDISNQFVNAISKI